jgi:hypothetical protein
MAPFSLQEPIGKAVDPERLQAHGSVEGLFSLLRKNDKLGPPVMRVGLECDKPLRVQVIDDSRPRSRVFARTGWSPHSQPKYPPDDDRLMEFIDTSIIEEYS